MSFFPMLRQKDFSLSDPVLPSLSRREFPEEKCSLPTLIRRRPSSCMGSTKLVWHTSVYVIPITTTAFRQLFSPSPTYDMLTAPIWYFPQVKFINLPRVFHFQVPFAPWEMASSHRWAIRHIDLFIGISTPSWSISRSIYYIENLTKLRAYENFDLDEWSKTTFSKQCWVTKRPRWHEQKILVGRRCNRNFFKFKNRS